MTMSEGGTPGGCTGGTGCCIPTCNVDVTDSLGVSGVVRWTGNCQARASAPSGTQDFADDNYQMTWFTDENGQSVIDVFRKSDKIYDRWAVTNCKVPDSTGGSQCAPSGGSCVSCSLDLPDVGYCINLICTGSYPDPLQCPGLKYRRSRGGRVWRGNVIKRRICQYFEPCYQ
jgi:hypothetical protein